MKKEIALSQNNMQSFLIKIAGEAGLGIMTTGLAIGKYFARQGYEVFGYAEYPSLIRGGHNTYEIHISYKKIRSSKWEIDFLICLNKDAFEKHKKRLTKNSVVFFDPEEFEIGEKFIKVKVPVRKILKEKGDSIVFSNSIYLGALIGYLKGELEDVKTLLVDFFGKKGKEIVEKNFEYAKKGYESITRVKTLNLKQILKPKSETKKLVMTGNEAFSLSAVASDCRFYSAYPMTPSSSVLSTLALWQKETGMIVRHAEDEIGVINEALGASFAGARSAVGTSGGGFALMVESISYAGIAEKPIVVFLAQRPGPATGMPTWTEQGDLLFAINAGHGE
ncbi:MAG TPA: 2-oxoacid:acceptor oxidoreductase subunit alpha, partial [Pyrodictiaceae archaeon]|nr:2-oxoacid:acceptor oxidoreductase subunit alpha [Pyrodictiaceae archaeon]